MESLPPEKRMTPCRTALGLANDGMLNLEQAQMVREAHSCGTRITRFALPPFVPDA